MMKAKHPAVRAPLKQLGMGPNTPVVIFHGTIFSSPSPPPKKKTEGFAAVEVNPRAQFSPSH